MDRRSRTHLSATAAAAAPRPVNSCTAMSPEIFYPSSWATVWRTDRSGPRTFRTTLYVCVCVVGWFRFWLVLLPYSLEVGMLISSRPTGCVCVFWWVVVVVLIVPVGDDDSMVFFLFCGWREIRRWFFFLFLLAVVVVVFVVQKTGKRVVFSIVDVTRLLAVRHKLIHAHTSSTRTQGRTHTHSRTHKRLECARVFDSSLCVWAFILFLLLFFQDTLWFSR